jgi:hypothetical protein
LYMKEQTAPNKRLLLVKVEGIPEELNAWCELYSGTHKG